MRVMEQAALALAPVPLSRFHPPIHAARLTESGRYDGDSRPAGGPSSGSSREGDLGHGPAYGSKVEAVNL